VVFCECISKCNEGNAEEEGMRGGWGKEGVKREGLLRGPDAMRTARRQKGDIDIEDKNSKKAAKEM
jgi:hypothetical protein